MVRRRGRPQENPMRSDTSIRRLNMTARRSRFVSLSTMRLSEQTLQDEGFNVTA
jgi:hypothetical protein